MRLAWEDRGWDDYLYWANQDRKSLKKINELIENVRRTPFQGIGKPEPLRGNLQGYWSRRIYDCNRLVYLVENDEIIIIACRGHYN